NAPSVRQCTFCTPSAMSARPSRAATVAASETAGGNSTTVRSARGAWRSTNARTNLAAAAGPWCIFQFPAITGSASWTRSGAMAGSGVIEYLDPRQRPALEELERGAAARRDVGQPAAQAGVLERCRGVAATRDRDGAAIRSGGQPRRDPARAGGERL